MQSLTRTVINNQKISRSTSITKSKNIIGPYFTQYNIISYPFQALSGYFDRKTKAIFDFTLRFYDPEKNMGNKIPYSGILIINGVDFTKSKNIIQDLEKVGFIIEDPDDYYPTYYFNSKNVYNYAEYDEEYGASFEFGLNDQDETE